MILSLDSWRVTHRRRPVINRPVFFYGFEKSGILDGFSKIPVFFHTKRAAGENFEYFTSLSTDFLMFFHLF